MAQQMEVAFDKAMHEIYDRALKECGYRANRYLNMVNQLGGLKTAKQLLLSVSHPEGLTALWELGRLDLSMEALVLRDEWKGLFTDDELKVAALRLRRLGHNHGKERH